MMEVREKERGRRVKRKAVCHVVKGMGLVRKEARARSTRTRALARKGISPRFSSSRCYRRDAKHGPARPNKPRVTFSFESFSRPPSSSPRATSGCVPALHYSATAYCSLGSIHLICVRTCDSQFQIMMKVHRLGTGMNQARSPFEVFCFYSGARPACLRHLMTLLLRGG